MDSEKKCKPTLYGVLADFHLRKLVSGESLLKTVLFFIFSSLFFSYIEICDHKLISHNGTEVTESLCTVHTPN